MEQQLPQPLPAGEKQQQQSPQDMAQEQQLQQWQGQGQEQEWSQAQMQEWQQQQFQMQQMQQQSMNHHAAQGQKKTQLPSQVQANGQVFVGFVKIYDPSKGFGHIECAETKQMCGKDILLLRSYLGGQQVAQGDQVQFTVEQDMKGLKATNIEIIQSVGNQMGATAQQDALAGGGQLPSRALAEGAIFSGFVKSFDPIKGCGFIVMQHEDSKQMFQGRDIFLLKSYLNGQDVYAGDQVSFCVEEDVKGIKATNVMVMGDGTQGPADEDQMFTGIVKSYDANLDFGFIECAETQQLFQTHVLLSKAALHGTKVVNPGDQVQFTLNRGGAKGPVAKKVINLSGGAMSTQVYQGYYQGQEATAQFTGNAMQQIDETQVFVGTVKSFNAEKGFGFIDCEQTKQMFNKDVFLLKSVLQGQIVNIGNHVQFTVTTGVGKGPVAKEVMILQGGYGAMTLGNMQQGRAGPY